MKGLPDRNEWDRITEEAFRSSDEHVFSGKYRKQRDAMLRKYSRKDGRAVSDENDVRKRIKVTDNGRRRKWAAPVAGIAAAAVLIPGVVFGGGFLNSRQVPTAEPAATEPAALPDTKPVTEGMTYQLDWLPEGVYYDAAKDAYYDADNKWFMSVMLDVERRDPALLTGEAAKFASSFSYNEDGSIAGSEYKLDLPDGAGLPVSGFVCETELAESSAPSSDVTGYELSEPTSRYCGFCVTGDKSAVVSLYFRSSVSIEDTENIVNGLSLIDTETGEVFDFRSGGLMNAAEVSDDDVKLYLPTGCTIYEAAVIIEEDGICDGDDFLRAFNSCRDKLPEGAVPDDAPNMEGFITYDAYGFREGVTAEEVAEIISSHAEGFLADYSARAKAKGMTINEMMTLASIVEKESPSQESMVKIASVLKNRLSDPENFPHLCVDSTREYAENLLSNYVTDRSILDRYDTYESEGLPPAPICCPSKEAVEAVLDDFSSDYYYYVVNENTGKVYLAQNAEEYEEQLRMIEEQEAGTWDGESSEWSFPENSRDMYRLDWIPEGLTYDNVTDIYFNEDNKPFMAIFVAESGDSSSGPVPDQEVQSYITENKLMEGVHYGIISRPLGQNKVIIAVYNIEDDPQEIQRILDNAVAAQSGNDEIVTSGTVTGSVMINADEDPVS